MYRYLLAIAILFLGQSNVFATSKYEYLHELIKFKELEDGKLIFDQNLKAGVKELQVDLENCRQLNLTQRIIKFLHLRFNILAVSKRAMPKLYEFIEEVCKKHDITVPQIFISLKKNVNNAYALKLLNMTGAIIIGQQILLENDDEAIEAVIAHELGHIKFNHNNKAILLQLFVTFIVIPTLLDSLFNSNEREEGGRMSTLFFIASGKLLNLKLGNAITNILINKQFEWEADHFAYENVNRGKGLIKFFTRQLQKKDLQNKSFTKTREKIKEYGSDIFLFDYYRILTKYYFVNFNRVLNKGLNWVYENTSLGTHPSLENRIQNVKDYLASKNK